MKNKKRVQYVNAVPEVPLSPLLGGFKETDLLGCFDGTGVNSGNYKEILHGSYMERSLFVIFLDIDGVIYNAPDQEAVMKKVKELFPDEESYTNRLCSIAASYFFNKESLQNLDHLIEEIEKRYQVRIVISSAWRENRSVEELKTTILGIHNFSRYIVDKTPERSSIEEVSSYCRSITHLEKYSWQCRASEIQYWLTQYPEVVDFVVLDDQDDHLSDHFGERFFKTKYNELLTSEISDKILTKNLA